MNPFLSNLLSHTMHEMEIKICLDMIKESGLQEEFEKYRYKFGSAPIDLIDICKDFAKLHPDKFHVPEKRESYDKFIVLENGDE